MILIDALGGDCLFGASRATCDSTQITEMEEQNYAQLSAGEKCLFFVLYIYNSLTFSQSNSELLSQLLTIKLLT